MKIIKTVARMRSLSDELRASGRTISLVPTMGYLHEGHLQLMREAASHADVVIASVFVNPTQFGPAEDLEEYPRDLDGDARKCDSAGVTAVFAPPVEEMYPPGFQTSVTVERLSNRLCGLSRPVHFRGVVTVVSKLLNCVRPHAGVFGEKDYQQLVVIKRMVSDLNMDVRIIGVPTQREPDGLAMSSRNAYLSEGERRSALCLSGSLDLARRLFTEGERDASAILRTVEDFILSHPFTSVDYAALCDPVSLEDVKTLGSETLLALAVHVGRTRLIDNCILR